MISFLNEYNFLKKILLKQNISNMNERQQKERDDNEEPKNVN